MITAHVYIWPERGDVDYFLSKLAPKGQIGDCIGIREATTDKWNDLRFLLIFLRSVPIYL